MLEERWALLKWVTAYIKENEPKWDKEKKDREKENKREPEEWNKKKRLEDQKPQKNMVRNEKS